MAGVLVGASLGGQMADLWGRKKIIFLNSAGCAVVNIIAGFSNTWEMFIVCRFVLGLTIGGFLAVCVPYTTEFILPSKRAFVSVLPTFNIGICLMALFAWIFKDWQMLHWICGALTLPLLLGYCFLPESLRWLSVHGRIEEAEQVVKWIALKNKHDLPKDYRDIIKNVAAEAEGTGQPTKYTYIHIYQGRRLMRLSLTLQFLWLMCSMSSYGLSFGASAIGGNMYVSIFLLSAVTLCSNACVGFVVDRFGRKRTATFCLLLGSACGFTSLAVKLTVLDENIQSTAITVLSLINRGMLSAGFGSIMILTNEIYPTVMRALGFGASNVTARIGGMLAPFAMNFQDNPNLAFAFMGSVMMLAGLTVFSLEETKGKAMQDATSRTTKSGKAKALLFIVPAEVDGHDPNINGIKCQQEYSEGEKEEDRERKQKGVWYTPTVDAEIPKIDYNNFTNVLVPVQNLKLESGPVADSTRL